MSVEDSLTDGLLSLQTRKLDCGWLVKYDKHNMTSLIEAVIWF